MGKVTRMDRYIIELDAGEFYLLRRAIDDARHDGSIYEPLWQLVEEVHQEA